MAHVCILKDTVLVFKTSVRALGGVLNCGEAPRGRWNSDRGEGGLPQGSS